MCYSVQLAIFLPGLEITLGQESCSAGSLATFQALEGLLRIHLPDHGPLQKLGTTELDGAQALPCPATGHTFTGFVKFLLMIGTGRTRRGKFHASLSLRAGFESPAGPTPSPSAPPAAPWQGRSIASSKLWMLEFSAFLERQQDPDTVSSSHV